MARNVHKAHVAIIPELRSIKNTTENVTLWGELSSRIQSTAVEHNMLLKMTSMTKQLIEPYEASQQCLVLDDIGIFTASCKAQLKTHKEFKTGEHAPKEVIGGELMIITGEPNVPTPVQMVYQKLEILKAFEKWMRLEKKAKNSLDNRNKQLEQQKNSNGISKVKKIKSWCSEYELRGFMDMALRWGIDGVYESRTENNPYSVFDHYVKNARTNFDLFAEQLNTKLTKIENWKAIEIDLNSRFLKGLNQYINWYDENRNELKKFQPYCPYTYMLNVIERTKAEILEYFPEFPNETSRPQQSEKQKPEQEETELSKRTEKLKSIWLPDPKLTIQEFIRKGNDKRFWNDNLELKLQRNNSTFGTGKTFLGNVFIAFKGWAIPNHLDYKEAGKIFCEAFKIDIKESTKEPYKAFSSGNERQIKEIKLAFGVFK